ncbi:MAG TPA: SDR family NAD(P)-dependent oxidoreductase [Acidimicrobiales bacterium]
MNPAVDLSTSRVLVTGATGGLGGTIARSLHARGARLVLSGRRANALESLAGELNADAVVADLADPGDVDRLATDAGKIDVVVANAALPSTGSFLDFDLAELDRALAVNLGANVRLAHHLVPPMVERGRGHMCFMGSISSRAALTGGAVYATTKFGLRALAVALRGDLRGTGVGVSCVEPGFVRDAGMFAATGVATPTGMRTVSPDQVAAAVIEAIERDRGEVVVAPLEVRAFANLALAFPRTANAIAGSAAMRHLTEEIVAAQRHTR